MLSISIRRARLVLLALVVAGCSSVPWKNEPVGTETNLAFHLENNLLFLTSASVDGSPGRYIFGSANVRSVLSPEIAGTARSHHVSLSGRSSVVVEPAILDLRGVADGIVGADVIGSHGVTIDYRSQLVTYQKEGIHPELMTLFRYAAEPAINMTVDGAQIAAIVDTAIPDTLVLPRTNAGRGNVRVTIAGIDFGTVDVQYANIARARVGNRLLSRFLVAIDYGKRTVGLWRDPRM